MIPSAAPTADPRSYVLYIDDQQHPVPLVECYHATAGRSLCSTRTPRFPTTALSFVDSYYCAHCWRYYDAIQGSMEQHGVCSSCCICPFCQSVVTVHFSTPEGTTSNSEDVAYTLYYQCENCDWSSQKHCPDLSVTLSLSSLNANTDGSIVPSETLLTTATEQLLEILRGFRNTMQQSTDLQFTNLSEQWKQYYHSDPASSDQASKSSVVLRKSGENEKWSLPQLEAQLQHVHQRLHDTSLTKELKTSRSTSRTHRTIQDLLKEHDATKNVDALAEDEYHDISFFAYQSQQLVHTPRSAWYPLARPLELRHSHRSKAEVLRYNRPGILLKPKLNPLDGDSSVPFGAGQWFRKDASAIYVIPKIQILQQRRHPAADSSRHSFLLQVTNPTLGAVRCRFVPSSYAGESDYWNDATDDAPPTSLLLHVVVDPFHDTVLDTLQIVPSVASPSTTTVELLPAEDTLLESGSSGATMHPPIPDPVRDWDPSTSDDAISSMRWIGHQGATAWLEVTTRLPDTAAPPVGLPVALEIELGNGSWESSLIPVEKENDSVTFDVILVCAE